jgi:hypothetical protein
LSVQQLTLVWLYARLTQSALAFDNIHLNEKQRGFSLLAEGRTMIKMFVVVLGVNLGAALGWWLGSQIGLMTGYFAAIFGASIGLYLSRQYSRNYLD